MSDASNKGNGDQSLVSLANRRTRKQVESSGSASSFTLNDLQELLVEVLCRLPTTKSAFQCKLVCKNWYSLISTPYFAHRFITHHLKHHYHQNPSALIISYRHSLYHHRLFTVSDDPIFKSRGFKLNYLPESVMAVAAFNDLMLCCVSKKDGIVQDYICNPITMQWIALPLNFCNKDMSRTKVGFVLEPYYDEDRQGECTVNSEYRYRVVHFSSRLGIEGFDVMKYCSENSKWYSSVLQGREYVSFTNMVAYNGKLHWYNGENIVAYDPFNPDLTSFIDGTEITSERCRDGSCLDHYCIGVCRGFLRMMQLTVGRGVKFLTVWELHDYRTGGWSLEFNVCLEAMIPESPEVESIINGGRRFFPEAQPLGFHPNDGDIVYLHFYSSVILCNLQTLRLKMAGKVPWGSQFQCNQRAIPIMIPWWPTPIPTPPRESIF